jgi:hypothetical protein
MGNELSSNTISQDNAHIYQGLFFGASAVAIVELCIIAHCYKKKKAIETNYQRLAEEKNTSDLHVIEDVETATARPNTPEKNHRPAVVSQKKSTTTTTTKG